MPANILLLGAVFLIIEKAKLSDMGILISILSAIVAAFLTWLIVPPIKEYKWVVISIIGMVYGIVVSIGFQLIGVATIQDLNIYTIISSVGLTLVTLFGLYLYKQVRLPKMPRLDEHELLLSKN